MKNHSRLNILVAGILFLALSLSQQAQAQVQTARNVSMIANSKGYYEYLPQGYSATSTQKYPLILFIHGMGELGSTLSPVLRNGIPRLINQGSFPTSFTVNGVVHRFIVISPQFVAWPSAPDINSVLDYVVSHYNVDPARIYLTGLSMGGGATWDYGGNQGNAAYPKRVAAIVPICGAAYPSIYKARVIANNNLPVWAFHNSGDGTAPVSYTNDFVSGINSTIPAPNPLAKKTIFNVGGHDAWTTAYNPTYREQSKNVYEWMLQYTRSVGTPPTNTPPTVNAGADKTITLPTSSAQLAATASDPGGSIASYTWTKTAGPTSFTFNSTAVSNPSITNLVAGTYTFNVKVTDNQGATATDNISVIVNTGTTQPPPPPPTGVNYINVNVFGGANPYNSTEWNNWNIGAGAVTNITSTAFKYSTGATSTVKASISQSTGVGDNSVNYPGGMAPKEVLRYTSFSTTRRTLTISGLTVSKKYDIELYSARSNSGNSTMFDIGTMSQTVLSSNNSTLKVTFTGLTPNASGQIVVTLNRVNTYSYLNGFTIVEGSSSAAGSTVGTRSMQDAAVLEETDKTSSVSIYPNPVTDRVLLQTNTASTGKMKVQVYNVGGTAVKEFNFNKETSGALQTYLSLGDLSAGEYFIKIQIGDWTETKKIVKL
jgi:acetyl esterase/lipase